MAFSLVGYYKSVNTGGVLSPLNGLADQHITVQGTDIIVPSWAPIMFAMASLALHNGGTQFSSPSMRGTSLLDLSPLDGAVSFSDDGQIQNDLSYPRVLNPSEALRAYMSGSEGAPEDKYALAWLMNQIDGKPSGQMETVKLTGTATLTAKAWSQVPLTLTQQLRAGTYAIVGMRAVSAGAIAARLIIPGSAYRPGCPGALNDGIPDFALFRDGNLGTWGTFSHLFIPQAEFLSASADTAETVYLDLVKIA